MELKAICLLLAGVVTSHFAGNAIAFPQQFLLRSANAAPPDPTSPSATVGTTTTFLSWSSGGGSTASYKIAWQSGATAPIDCNSGSVLVPTGTSHTVTGLTATSQYSYRICALNALGTASGGVTLTATQNAGPPTPLAVSANANGTTQITVGWTSGGGTSAAFVVASAIGSTPPADCSTGTVVSVPEMSLPFTGLTSGTTYSYRVCARDGSMNLSGGLTASVSTLTTTPTWYTGITYVGDLGSTYGTCAQPSEATMNDELTTDKLAYGSSTSINANVRADLGSSKTVSAIRVGGGGPITCWSDSATYWLIVAASIQIQTSPDASTWTTVATGNAAKYSNSAIQTIAFSPVTARYVRLFVASGWLATGQFRIGN